MITLLPSSAALNIANTAPVVDVSNKIQRETNRNRSTTQYGRVNRSVHLFDGQHFDES